ncbi:alpha/beta hydrolase family protein [Actinocorallia libanotica]|uniref:Chlorophyllase-like protein n=1 Tax=Actinocorallia libanotica TaxID=46162 RepID=A0ABP4B8C2_9ACTN
MRLRGLATATVLTSLLTGLAAGLSAPAAADTGVAHYSSQIENDGTDVYYPSGATGELPVALMLQGAQVHRMHYARYAREIASHGFVVVVPNHKRLLFFDNDYYASQSQPAETVDWMDDENARAGSPLQGRIDTDTLVLLGHSFGGATGLAIAESTCVTPFCTGLTYTMPSEVKAGSFFGTNNKLPGLGIFPEVDNRVPVQLVQGTADGVALPADAETTYGKIKDNPKQIVRLAGANHYGITDAQNPAGADPDAAAQTITQDQSIETAARWAARFLKAALGDAAAAGYVWSTGDAADPLVTVTGAQ